MRIAIDKNSIKHIDKLGNNEIIYVFDENEDSHYLLSLGLHCVRYDLMTSVEINLTDYDIDCIKKAKITDKDCLDIPPKKDYKFAIIVPNCNNDHGEYKGKTFFENCIESILNQTYKDFKLIIVDDCSTDTSVETVEKYMKKDDRIILIKNKRKRYNGGSRNVGIEYALDNLDFDYFCFLDSDDWWKHDKVLETINREMYNHDLMLLGLELIDKTGVFMTKIHQYNSYSDFFLSDNNVWCTAWARVIKKEKIVYFCESTLMEDRVWSYRQADNVDLNKVKNLKEVCYVWNRMNTTNSVSLSKSDFWNASAYCHIGNQLQFLSEIKHKEMIPVLEERIKHCEKLIQQGIYQQY